jgi:hypothetical protein
MSRALVAVPLLLAALASGCGGSASSAGDFEGEEQRVAELVEQLQSAGETGDAAEICDEVLAQQLRDQIQEAGATCEQELDKAIKDADDFELEVEDVTITGDSATAEVRGRDRGEERVREFEFVRERGGWRATSLGSG